jgi:hypothetical protein
VKNVNPTFAIGHGFLGLFGGIAAVVRQNFSRDPKRGGSGGVVVITIIDSVQRDDPERASPVRVERAYIKDRPRVDPNYAARL